MSEVFNALLTYAYKENKEYIRESRSYSFGEARAKKESVSHFEIGDIVNVHCRIREGDKERIQIFNGVVIAAAALAFVKCLPFVVSLLVKA